MNVDRRTPIVSLLILTANLGAAFLLFWQPEVLDSYGFYSARPNPLSAVTSLFLHANLVHLLGNMVFLAAAGPAAEAAVGSLRFFGMYMASGLVGVAAHWVLGSRPEMPLIGASGAVAGCVALASVRFFAVKVPLAPGLSVPIVAVSGLWLVLQVVGSFVQLGGQAESVAYWAHLGGAVAGLLLALAFKTQKDADREASAKVLDTMSGRSPAAVLAAAEEHLRAHPRDFRALSEKGVALAKLGEGQLAAQVFQILCEEAPASMFHTSVELALSGGCLDHVPSLKRTLWAERLKSGHARLAQILLQSVVEGPASDPQRPDAMLALAELSRAESPGESGRLAADLMAAYPLHPAAEIAKAKEWPS